MFDLREIVEQAQGGQGIQNLARQFGITEEQASNAVSAVLPAVSAGLQNKTRDAVGLAEFFGAVLNDRHQQAFDNSGSLADDETIKDGNDVAARMFNTPEAPDQVAQYAAQSTGLNSSLVKSMLPVIISMVMGGLFKNMKSGGLGGLLEQMGQMGGNGPGNSSGGLGDILGQVLGGRQAGTSQSQHAPQPAPRPAPRQGGLGGLLGGLLGGVLGRRGGGTGTAADGDLANLRTRPDQIFPEGFNPDSLRGGLETLGNAFQPGGSSGGAGQGSTRGPDQPGLDDLLGQILGRR